MIKHAFEGDDRNRILDWFRRCIKANKDFLSPKGTKDFNKEEKFLCGFCPFRFDEHNLNCLECCPITNNRE